MDFTTPIKEAGLTFRLKQAALLRLQIATVEDLLFHLPFRYEDYTNALPMNKIKLGETAVVKGKVIDIKNEYTKRRFVLQKAQITDGTATISVTWFNQSYITRIIHPGDEVGIVGKLEFFGKKPSFQVKEYEVLSQSNGIHTTGLVPVYSETKGLSSKWIRNRIFDLLTNHKEIVKDFLPDNNIKSLKYKSLFDALYACHFPKNYSDANLARERLAFDELFLAMLAAIKRRDEWNKKNKGIPFRIKEHELSIKEFIKSLPFTLTDGQVKSVEEIKADLQKDVPMNRLLEGDVGSGKTVVAAISMYMTHLEGYQSAFMAPTEILAQQHFKTLHALFEPLGIEVGLITGSHKLSFTTNQPPPMLVGTHSLIQKGLNFENLGLVVIDEQQRFGVEQRSILRGKGRNPHFLTMTATPIPRTILLAIYKDLDLSQLQEVPSGRKKIKTWLVPPIKRKSAYKWIKDQIVNSGYQDQAFVVCPFIEESESMDTVKSAKKEFERLQKEDLKGLKLGLLHGKLKGKEKDQVLKDFKDKKYHVLVATPVVEVGIDIPDATVMVIDGADRFGLAQLHQLRGRVGRSDKQSYCILFSESEDEMVQKRLKYMETAHSGFELAELDLRLRGGGDLFGTAQHGFRGFKVANFSDTNLVEKAKKEAEEMYPRLLEEKTLLEKVENVSLKLIHPD
jgi:ATP-dependent DNA helicase RecG